MNRTESEVQCTATMHRNSALWHFGFFHKRFIQHRLPKWFERIVSSIPNQHTEILKLEKSKSVEQWTGVQRNSGFFYWRYKI